MPPRRFLLVLLSLTLWTLPAPGGPPRLDRQGDPLPPGAIARLGTLRFRLPSRGVAAFTLSPDGRMVFVADGDLIQAWDVATGAVLNDRRLAPDPLFARLIHKALGEERLVDALAVSTDGKSIVAHVADEIVIWEVGTGRQRCRLPNPGLSGTLLSFSSDGKTLVVSDPREGVVSWWDLVAGKRLRRWDIFKGKRRHLTGALGLRTASWAAASPDGKTLAGGIMTWKDGKEGTTEQVVKVWDTAAARELWRFDPGDTGFADGAFSPDGRILAVEHQAGTVSLREAATGKVLRSLRGAGTNVVALGFSGDGRTLVSAHSDLSLCVWDVAGGKLRCRLDATDSREHSGGIDLSLSLSADGKRLAVAVNGSLRLWDTTTGRETPRFPGHRTEVQRLGFSPDGRSLLSASVGAYCRWDTASWRESERGPVWGARPRAEDEVVLAVSLGANRLLERDKDGRLQLRELISNRLLRRLPTSVDTMVCVFSGNGKVILVPQQPPRGRDLIFLDADSGKELRRVRGARALSLLTSLDGRVAAWLGPESEHWPHFLDAGGKVHHLGKDLAKDKDWLGSGIQDAEGQGLVVSADGRCLALARSLYMWGSRQFLPDERIYLWDTTGGRLLHVLTGVRGVATNLGLSPDGRTLAVTYTPQPFINLHEERMRSAVYLWEVASGRPRGRLEGHREAVSCIAWSPDGRFLVSGSEDSTLLVWDMSDPLPSKKPKEALTAKELTGLWEDLSNLDAEKAYRAIGRLAGSPGQAVTFLRERLRLVAPPDPARLRKLVADLDNPRFAVRTRAANELEAMQESAAPALRELLKGKLTLEYRRRAERLLGRLEASVPPPERLRAIRAVEVLELIGTSEARRLLQTLTRGAPEVRLTREASAAVRRLTARAARP